MAILIPIPDEAPRDDAHDRLRDLISAINGYSGQGVQWNLTTYDSDSRYGMQLRNLGTDGLHFAVFHSGSTLSTDTPIVEIQDAGLFITDTDFRVYDGLNVVLNVDGGGVTVGSGYPVAMGGGLSVTGEIIATGDITSGGTLEADDGLDVIGGATISGAITLNGAVTATSTLDVAGSAFFDGSVTISATNNLGAPLVVQNLGSGPLLSILTALGASAMSLSASGALTVAGAFSAGGDINTATDVNAGDVVKGRQLESTVATGTAPLIVASTTKVTNLNAEMLNGMSSSDFVEVDGDTMTGDLEIQADLIVTGDTVLGTGTADSVTIQGGASALILRYEEDPADGQWTIGLNDGANPHLVFKDTAGVEVIKFRADSATDPQFECSNWGKFDNQLSVGGGNSDFLKVYGGTEAIYVYYSPSMGCFTIGASNETDPNLQFKDNSGDNILTLYDDDNNETVFGAGESVQAKLFGGLWIADKGGDSSSAGLYVDGKAKFEYISVGSSSSTFGGAVTFSGQTYFNSNINLQSGADIDLGSGSRIICSEGSSAGKTTSSWDGCIEITYGGSTRYVPYRSSW